MNGGRLMGACGVQDVLAPSVLFSLLSVLTGLAIERPRPLFSTVWPSFSLAPPSKLPSVVDVRYVAQPRFPIDARQHRPLLVALQPGKVHRLGKGQGFQWSDDGHSSMVLDTGAIQARKILRLKIRGRPSCSSGSTVALTLADQPLRSVR